MALWDSLRHITAQPIGWGAKATGGALNALPGYSTTGARLSSIGGAITNPNVVYTGAINPLSSNFGASGGANWKQTMPQNVAQSGGGNTLGWSDTNDAMATGDGGAYGQQGVDANYRNTLADKLRSIMSAYDALTGSVDTVSNDAIQRYNDQYNSQASDLNNEYAKTTNQLAGVYGARGLADSSYYGNAQDEAKNTYNTNSQSLIGQRDQNLATIGQQAAGAKAGYAAGKAQYGDIMNNLNNYGQNDLTALGQQLPGVQAQLGQAQAGQGTQADFIRSIQGLPALQNGGSAQLQAQLQRLSATGAPQYAKNQIAQGIIGQAQLQDPNQQNQWQDYWRQITGG